MNEKIKFGQKHLGHTHLEAWQDQPWTTYMINHYGKSKAPAHRRLLRFVADDRAPREGPDGDSSPTSPGVRGRICRDHRPFWKRVSPVQDESPAIKPNSGHLFGRRHGGGVRDVHMDDYEPAHHREPGVQGHPGAHAEPRECLDPSDSSSRAQDRGSATVDPDPDLGADQVAEASVTVHEDVQHLWTLIAKMNKEFQTAEDCCQAIGKPFVLGEVFCSSQSLLKPIRSTNWKAKHVAMAKTRVT